MRKLIVLICLMFSISLCNAQAVYRVDMDTITLQKVDSILTNMPEKKKVKNLKIILYSKKQGSFEAYCEGEYRQALISRKFRKQLLR